MQKRISAKLVLLHLVAWTVFISLMAFTGWVYNPAYHLRLGNMLFTYSQAAFIFYGSNYLFFHFLPRRKFGHLIIGEVLFFGLVLAVLTICYYVLEPLFQGQHFQKPDSQSLGWFLVSTVFWLYLLLSVLSLGYYFACRTVFQQQALGQAERSKLLAEQGRLEAEHAFLRAQINPHFLYNTLNFFYAKSLGRAPEISEGILLLNDIMRYSLESGEDDAGLVPLRKEVEHLQNVIGIHQLRFSNRLQVGLHVQGELNGLRIVPLVLITLVENAFKHGDLNDEEHPVQFRLHIHPAPRRRIHFTSVNKKKRGPVENYSGIGLANIRKRLDLAYGKAHRLQIENEAHFYTVTLEIDLL